MTCARTLVSLVVVCVVASGSLFAGNTGSAGGGQPIDSMQPSNTLTVLIAKDGHLASGPETGGTSAGGPTMIGEIRLFAGSIVPGGFLLADGSLVTIASAPGLYNVIGTTFGGDGVTNFRLPDLRGRALAGMGQGPGLTSRSLGELFGTEKVTQSITQLPAHTHTLAGGTTGSTGGSQPLPNVQPTQAVRPLICPFGTFEYLPEIRFFGGNYEPGGGWLTCDGRQLSIEEYGALYNLLGTVWGGDGTSTFAIPNYAGQVAAGSGTGPGLVGHVTGETLGVESNSLTSSQLPGHAHNVTNGQTGFTGSGTFKENHQPTLIIRFMIASTGIVPSTGTTNTTSTPTIGEIRPFAADSGIPSGWMLAEGQTLTTASNPNLFAAIGNAFGGDGVTTFALPDLRGRTPIGTGQAPGMTNRLRGNRMGSDGTVISLSEVIQHSHAIDPSGLRHPGAAPSLTIAKNSVDPTKIDLSWGAGCASGVTGYAVYQGVIGSFTSHVLFAGACDVAATSLVQQTPCATNCYYLVSAIDDLAGEEGSLGKSSSNVETPRPASPCQAAVDLGACN